MALSSQPLKDVHLAFASDYKKLNEVPLQFKDIATFCFRLVLNVVQLSDSELFSRLWRAESHFNAHHTCSKNTACMINVFFWLFNLIISYILSYLFPIIIQTWKLLKSNPLPFHTAQETLLKVILICSNISHEYIKLILLHRLTKGPNLFIPSPQVSLQIETFWLALCLFICLKL